MRVPLIGAVALVGVAFVATPAAVSSAAPLGGISNDLVQQTQSSDFSAQKKLKKAAASRVVVKKGGGGRVVVKKGGGGRVVVKKGGGGRVVVKKGGGGRVVGGGGWQRGGGSNVGAAAAGAAIGLAIGAIIAGEAAHHQQAVQYCINRYRSYNPRTGIWIDRHGRRRHCP